LAPDMVKLVYFLQINF